MEDSERIIPKHIEDEMKQSYLDYSMSVIIGRALPDVRDGLKPVHRRILYAMYEMGMFHNKPFKKSARVVGETLGKFHPHGDAAVYDAMVRMVQPFSLRYPLLQGQGNFGSIDGDNAAAMRYTEIRLNRLAEEMLQDIDKRTVKFVDNFDASLKEPSILPAKLPNLLLNGSSGIAVGMATNIPPHNLGEVIDGIMAYIDNPEIRVEELIHYIKGPDFPTGAIICNKAAILEAYKQGKGKIIVRAKTLTEKNNIIITEIPYMVNKAELVKEIAELVRNKKIEDIINIRDESDRKGIRVVIELKQDVNPELILNQLYKHTRLQVTFGVIMIALVNNEPKLLNLKDLIRYYVEHRKEIVKKRTLFELHKAQQRTHILEGLLIALTNIDKCLDIIKKSKTIDEARNSLITAFNLSKEQATAVLNMKLQKLASLEQEKIKTEYSELKKKIEELKNILISEARIYKIIKQELIALKNNYNDERRTEIRDETIEFDIEDFIKKEDVVVTITNSGYIKRVSIDKYKTQRRGGKGIIGATTKEDDFVTDIFIANTFAYILFFTNKGKVYWLKVYNIPEAARRAKGKPIINLIKIDKHERITAIIPIEEFNESYYLVMVTRQGIIKRVSLTKFSNPRSTGIIAILLRDDELVDVKLTRGSDELMIATKNGKIVRLNESCIRAMNRNSIGVRGIKLKPGDEVIGLIISSKNKTILTITENGYGKRTRIDEYRLTSRGCSGVINIICNEKNGKVIDIKAVSEDDELMLVTKKGLMIRIKVRDVPIIGRRTLGVRLMKLGNNDKIASTARIRE